MSEPQKGQGFWNVRTVRELSFSLLIVVVTFKLAFADFKFDMAAFNFSDFLSLILAISAVGLSVAFYFKADESAKQFYDNSYNFTKDISIILGRIETGFSEKLSTLNKGYDDINRRLGQSSQTQDDQLESRISDVERKLKSSIDEVFNALPKVGDGAGAAEKLRSKVEGAASELDELRAKQSAMERLKKYHPKFVKLISTIARGITDRRIDLPADDDEVSVFERIAKHPEFGKDELSYMRNESLLDRNDELSREGAIFIRDIIYSL